MSGGAGIARGEREENGNASVFEAYEEDAERFESDTRRYLKEHLLDVYPSVGQAIGYNLIQNILDNRDPGQPVTIKFSYFSKEKRFQFIASGYKGIEDWDRYNRLHAEGRLGSIRRGEGAKVLVPIAESVRTETKLADGTYFQGIWREDRIWRSDRESETKIFEDLYPPTAIPSGTTIITAEDVYDTVGDRNAGIDLADARGMIRNLQMDWDLLLREHPEVSIIYEVDGHATHVKPWEYPKLEEQDVWENLSVVDATGKEVGVVEKMALFFSNTPLTDTPPPAISVSTHLHAVTYLSIYGGPNANRLFGYVKADFLDTSETTNHLSFKSTRAYRLVRDLIAVKVDSFMRPHVGVQKSLDSKTAKLLSQVTSQINALIRQRFPDWHPEGGFKEIRESPEPRTKPWIRAPKTTEQVYQPEEVVVLTFQVVNPDKQRSSGSLEARARVVRPDGKRLFKNRWRVEVPPAKFRLVSDIFTIPGDAPTGMYTGRISLVDDESNPIHERRISFHVGDAPEEAEKKLRTRRAKRKRKVKKKKGDALGGAYPAKFPPEEDKIRESALDLNELLVYLNRAAPSFTYAWGEEKAQRYHVAKCQIEELAQLKLERELGLLEEDELTKNKITTVMRDLKEERSTFLSEWAKIEDIRIGKRGEPLGR